MESLYQMFYFLQLLATHRFGFPMFTSTSVLLSSQVWIRTVCAGSLVSFNIVRQWEGQEDLGCFQGQYLTGALPPVEQLLLRQGVGGAG